MNRTAPTERANVLIDQITDWLMGEALGEPDIDSLIEGTAGRVEAAGIPINRLNVAFTILHPLYQAAEKRFCGVDDENDSRAGHQAKE